MVCVFARNTSETLASLVKQIDKKIGENKKLKSFVVVMPQKGEKPAGALKKLAESAGVKHIPLTIGEGPNGPPDYEVSGKADVTVLLWSHHKVKFNHGFKGDLSEGDISAVMEDVTKLLAD